MNNLIEAWLSAQNLDVESNEYDTLSWAVDELFDLSHDDPKKLLSIVLEILKIDSSQKTIGALGAGVLEELLVHHGDHCIDYIEELSRSDEKFKSCLQFTFIDQDDVSAATYKKFQAIKKELS